MIKSIHVLNVQRCKMLYHIDPTMSHVAYLYQDMKTNKYYLSHTPPDSENTINNSKQYLLMHNEPKTTKQSFLNNIDIVAEVTTGDFMLNQMKNYKLRD